MMPAPETRIAVEYDDGRTQRFYAQKFRDGKRPKVVLPEPRPDVREGR